jgi:signal transduction histidine kinase
MAYRSGEGCGFRRVVKLQKPRIPFHFPAGIWIRKCDGLRVVTTQTRLPEALRELRAKAKPKPYSVERRFQLMQSGTIALALLLVSGVLYGNYTFRNHLATSLRQLNSALALNRQIHSNQENTMQTFWNVYDLLDSAPSLDYKQGEREGIELVNRYAAISSTRDEEDEVSRLRALQTKFMAQSGAMLAGPHPRRGDAPERAKVGKLDDEIEEVLGRLEDLQVQRLDALNAQVDRSSNWLTLLLLMFAGFELLATIWFRRAHQNHLWGHLEGLRQMVGEVRSGNLEVSCEIPQSVELGPLMGAFVEMAAELTEMRGSLERKVVERTAKLELAQKELLQSSKLASLGQLVAGVAHEINNPLTAILGFSEITLSRPELDSFFRGPLNTIREEALRLRNLVENLNSFSRRAPHRKQLFDLRTVVTRLVDLRGYQMRADKIAIHVEQPQTPIWVTADADQLLQVLVNLAMNAEQAIRERGEGGNVWLISALDGGTASVEVRDDGAGIPADARAHIFEPFFTTKPAGSGTGLGLSISHGIIQQHGGTIAAESSPGAATTIRIELPATSAPAAEPGVEPANGKSAKGRGPATVHALVIDDEEDILELIRSALKPLNCHTTLLHGSAGVRAALEQSDFDLVICDLKMPGQNGLEVLRLIRGMRRHLASHFLLMTGNLRDADDHAAELEDVPILPKPFTLARLREAVGEVLGAKAVIQGGGD